MLFKGKLSDEHVNIRILKAQLPFTIQDIATMPLPDYKAFKSRKDLNPIQVYVFSNVRKRYVDKNKKREYAAIKKEQKLIEKEERNSETGKNFTF